MRNHHQNVIYILINIINTLFMTVFLIMVYINYLNYILSLHNVFYN